MTIPVFDHQQGNITLSKATYTRLASERDTLKQQIRREVIASYLNAVYQEARWQRIHTMLLPLADVVDR